MNIIRQLALFIGVKTDTLVTISITIFVFSMGLVANGIAYKLKRRKYNKDIRNCFISILESIIQSLSKQSEEFKKYSDGLRAKNSGDLKFSKIYITHIDSINKIPFLDLFNSFINSRITFKQKYTKRINAFNDIFNKYGLIIGIEKNNEVLFSELKIKLASFENEWNENLDSIRKIFEDLALSMDPNALGSVKNEFFKEFDELMYQWQQSENRYDKFNTESVLLLPLKKIIIRYSILKEVYTPLMNNILSAMHAFENNKKIMHYYANHFENCNEIYSTSIREIKNSIVLLK